MKENAQVLVEKIQLSLAWSQYFVNNIKYAEINEEFAIEVNLGEEFEITFRENPSTGYIWHPIFNQEIFELVRKDYRDKSKWPEGTSDGIALTRVFVFKALRIGVHSIEFQFGRVWDKSMSKAMRYVINCKGEASAN